MEIRTLKIGKDIWQLVNESWENSYAWGHKTNILKNGIEWGEHKCRYYNRTWERYTYQSCMFGAINEIKDRELNNYINDYKYENNIVRFKKGEKEQVIKQFEKSSLGKDLKKLERAVEFGEFTC